MRVALISDIHGNRWALEAVLDHIVGQRVDAIWNLGDILSGPLAPAATAELLMPLALPTIAGNHERQLLACGERAGGASDQHAFEHTEPHHRAWLRALPAIAEPHAGVMLCHGTPGSDVIPLLETVAGSEQRPASRAEIDERVAGTTARLIACGHTHVARLVRTSDGRTIVNPGSVGLPAYDSDFDQAVYYVDNGSPHASYAIVEPRDDHAWDASFHRVAYDWEAAAACAERNRRPEWAYALRTGFALRA
ncbi:MAG TPA: metallophosphoesterase family protein [Kofleriaceae bacterium]|nr:metallophosphoesterase family protein [Kofleriaceae bacterium]